MAAGQHFTCSFPFHYLLHEPRDPTLLTQTTPIMPRRIEVLTTGETIPPLRTPATEQHPIPADSGPQNPTAHEGQHHARHNHKYDNGSRTTWAGKMFPKWIRKPEKLWKKWRRQGKEGYKPKGRG